MQFNRKTDYGLIFLKALKPTYRSGRYLPLSAIAEREHLPFTFLEKIAGALKREGTVGSQKGAAGGYRLVRDPKTITLKQIIDLLEEPPMMRCMRSPHPSKYCPLVPTCPTRRKWLDIEREVSSIFEKVTVAQL